VYIYTDDDLNRVNRDYLGPKGRRLPFVATYRTYGVTIAVVVVEIAVFMFVGVPLNQWTGLIFCFCAFLSVTYVIRRLNGDVSIVAMFRAGWQEVTVPRPPTTRAKEHVIHAQVQKFDYDAIAPPRWWELKKKRAARRAASPEQSHAVTTGKHRPESTTTGPPTRAGAKKAPASRRVKKQRAGARKA
jgi:hypothetical protein